MALQLRLGGGAIVAAAVAHAAYVHEQRSRVQPRPWSPGSEDVSLAESLRTGDLLLFSRPCELYQCGGAALCAVRKASSAGATHFDHAGVVVLDAMGTPYVLERTWSKLQLRRFDHRIQCSRSKEILLRRLQSARIDGDPTLRGRVDVFVRTALADEAAAGAAPSVRELLQMGRGPNGSAALVAAFYAAAAAAASQPADTSALSITDLATSRAPHSGRLRFGHDVWVRSLR